MPSTNREKKNQTNKEYYHRNKERILAKFRESSAEVYAKNKDTLLRRSKESRTRNYEHQILRSAKNRALRDDIDFDISIEDIVIPTHCPYLGCELTRTQGEGHVWSNASIDRIDNSKGYVKGNVEIISRKANTMKNHATSDELYAFAQYVLRNEQLMGILK